MIKKFLATLLAVTMLFALAACGGNSENNSNGSQGGKFTSAYQYDPPKDNYYIKWQDFTASGEPDGEEAIYARIGGGYTYAKINNGVWHASSEQQKYYSRAWDGEYSDWMIDPTYSYENWKADREEFGNDYGFCDAFEDYFMRLFRDYGFDEDESKLAEYYVGSEEVAGVNCWVFDSKGLNTSYLKFWIDPSNGCCLKYMDIESGSTGRYYMVTEYNLNYTSWTDNLAPSSYEGIESR